MAITVLIPLPTYGADPTEVAIPWKLLTQKGYDCVFITPDGKKAILDNAMLSGTGLGIWKSILRAKEDAVAACREMEQSAEFCSPRKYDAIEESSFDALLLPGGHDKGVKEYLESIVLQSLVANFFAKNKPIAAICHGVVLAARSTNADTGQPVLHGYKTTSLLKSQEMLAYNMTRLWMGDYYLTYPGLTVEDEVRSVLESPEDYLVGPTPMGRDDLNHLQRGFTVRDRNYVSARWPGDAYSFSLDFISMLQEAMAKPGERV